MIVVTSQVERWEAWSKLCLLELKVAYVVRCSSILPCEMAMVSHHIIKWTLADPAVSWVKFPMNPLDIVFKHFNKYLSNIFFILAVCPRDDWLLWIKLIGITNDMLLLFICETLITPLLTATYWFTTRDTLNEWLWFLNLITPPSSGILILTTTFLKQYFLWSASFSLLEK